MSRGFLYCLKRERDIFIKPKLSGGKIAFMCTPALKQKQERAAGCNVVALFRVRSLQNVVLQPMAFQRLQSIG